MLNENTIERRKEQQMRNDMMNNLSWTQQKTDIKKHTSRIVSLWGIEWCIICWLIFFCCWDTKQTNICSSHKELLWCFESGESPDARPLPVFFNRILSVSPVVSYGFKCGWWKWYGWIHRVFLYTLIFFLIHYCSFFEIKMKKRAFYRSQERVRDVFCESNQLYLLSQQCRLQDDGALAIRERIETGRFRNPWEHGIFTEVFIYLCSKHSRFVSIMNINGHKKRSFVGVKTLP